MSVLDLRDSAEKPDTSHDALRHPCRVGTECFERRRSHPVALVHRDKHQQCRGNRDKGVSAKASGATMECALGTRIMPHLFKSATAMRVTTASWP